MSEPSVVTTGPSSGAAAVVVLLPGGKADSFVSYRRGLAYLRMVPFGWAVRRKFPGIAVWRLRYRYRGWNEPHRHPVADAEWAIREAATRLPGVPVLLVGHSMGGRTALRLSSRVAGVCALAPWIEPNEPFSEQTAGTVVLAHGDQDRITDPAMSARYAASTDASFILVAGEGHAMLRRSREWTRIVLEFVGTVGRSLAGG
ncbi:alpha/beta hydrolase [Dactylosporangium siamense]|uniref:alpha/beta hydrolase n=1 Tax=Dactylosporangium siamense TaxID=685454 RepID=UPI001943BC8E|nr:alpha/beta fold hydrolase [Dactylosporangium siamense]